MHCNYQLLASSPSGNFEEEMGHWYISREHPCNFKQCMCSWVASNTHPVMQYGEQQAGSLEI